MSKALDELAKREAIFARRSSSLSYLNCALALMAHDYTISEVKKILRDHADLLEEFG